MRLSRGAHKPYLSGCPDPAGLSGTAKRRIQPMITIERELLHAALNAVTRASLKSSLMAAFSLVRLDAGTSGVMHLSCFNGETAARATVNVDCNEDLSVSVDAQTLKAVVETLAGEIRMTVEDNSLILQSASNR